MREGEGVIRTTRQTGGVRSARLAGRLIAWPPFMPTEPPDSLLPAEGTRIHTCLPHSPGIQTRPYAGRVKKEKQTRGPPRTRRKNTEATASSNRRRRRRAGVTRRVSAGTPRFWD